MLYPAFLKLAGLRVVVVGGGQVAASKLAGLLAAGARITVVAPAICDEIQARALLGDEHVRGDAVDPPDAIAARARRVELVERAFVDADLDGARWVVAAATPEVNQQVAAAAAARGLFVNAVDDTAAATAYLGGVIRRGEVAVAISTGGAAPALAGLVREALDALLPADLARWVDVAAQARREWKAARVPMAERRPLLLRALVALYEARAPEEHRRPYLLRAIDRLGGSA